MRNLFAKITVCLLLCAAGSFSALGAEKVIFEASSPLVVAVGELFRVEFSLNTRPDEQSFRAPSFEGFEVLAGPSLSEGTSMSSVNGGPMTRQYQMTLTYVVRVAQAGNVTLGPAEIAAGGETYRTAPLTIEAVAEPAEAGEIGRAHV